jgi:hypothetical protein
MNSNFLLIVRTIRIINKTKKMASNILSFQRFTTKILVDGIYVKETENEVKSYLEIFGRVIELTIAREPMIAYAYVTFESVLAYENLSKLAEHKINERIVNIQKVTDYPSFLSSGQK